MNYSVLHIEGGLGKNVAATAVAKCIKENHPDRELIVVCSYPEVFLHLPFVHRVYRIGIAPYFYETYIEIPKGSTRKETLIFKHEPYFTNDHIYKKKPLIENWCEFYGLEYSNEQPELNISKRIREYVAIKYQRQKPIMLIQSNGGLLQGQNMHYAWTRDMPKELVQAVVNKYSQKYHILQVCRSEFNVAHGAEGVFNPMSNLELFALLSLSEKRLLIDSCLQHAAAALDIPSTVLWVGSPSKVFGYDLHSNIQANPPKDKIKLPDSYLFDYNFEGLLHEYPYSSDEKLFNIEEIFETLN